MVVAGHLRPLHLAALAEREIEESGAVEDDAPAEVQPAGSLRLLDEQHAQIDQAMALELGARELGARAALTGTGVGEVHETVLGEARMQRHLEQAALPAREDPRHAFDRHALEIACDEIEPTGALGDEHLPIRQEGERPRVVEPFHELDHADGLALRLERLRAERKGQKQNERDEKAHGAYHSGGRRSWITRRSATS